MENLLLPLFLCCPQGHQGTAAQVLPSLLCSFAGGLGMLPYIYMGEPTLECCHGLTKWLLAKMWLTNVCMSPKGGKVPSKSHPTSPNEGGWTDGGRFVALCPQGICMGEPCAGGNTQLLPTPTGRVSCRGLFHCGGSWEAAVMHSS